MKFQPVALALSAALGAPSAFAHELLYERAFAAPSSYWSTVRPAVAGVGDVNSDQVPDFAVTRPLEGNGSVIVISGASKQALYTFLGDAQTLELGHSLALIGDLDLDGIGDLAVGALGSVRVYSLGSGQVLYTLMGSGPISDFFGAALTGVGDVDGDALPDFAVGAPQGYAQSYHSSSSGPGFVQVFSGTGALIRTIPGPVNQVMFGGSLANVGNLDGDGIDDMLVSPTMRIGGGPARAYSGATGAELFALPNQPYSGGAVVAGLGDVDGDGIGDFALGYRWNYGVVGISGGTLSTLFTRDGLPESRFGCALARIGDVDGDGAADLLVGARQHHQCIATCVPFNPLSAPGYASVLSGRTGSVLETVVGNGWSQHLGTACADLGDLDGDGKDEFLITTDGSAPSVRIYSGRTGYSTPQRFCMAYGYLSEPAIGFTGTESVAQNQFASTLTSALGGQSCILFCGPTASSIQLNFPFGSMGGYLCVGSPMRRIGLPQAVSAQGSALVPVDIGVTSPFAIGSTWYFQFALTTGVGFTGFSDALAVTFTP